MTSFAQKLFLFALLIRLTVVLLAISDHSSDELLTLTPDSQNYVGAAQAMTRGEILEHRNDLFYFPPGYPSVLAASFFVSPDNPIPILILQAVLSALTCVLIYLVSIELGLAESVARLSGLLFCFSITANTLTSIILSDTLYVFLFALLCWLFLRTRRDESSWLWILVGLV